MIAWANRIILYALFLTLGTYAVPELRVYDLPYTVPIAGLLAAFIVLECLMGRDVRVMSWLVTPSLLYLASVIGSSLFAELPDWPMTLKYAAFGLTPLVISIAVRDVATVKGCLACLMISALAVFVYGLYGYFSGNVGSPIEHQFGYFGVTYLESTRNGDQLFFLVPFGVCLAAFLQPWRRPNWLFQLAVLACMLALAAAMALSFARGVWIAMAVVCAVMLRRVCLASRARFLGRVLTLSIILVVGASAWFSRLDAENLHLFRARSETLFTLQDREGGNSNANRLEIATQALRTALDHPLLGVGVGNARYHLFFERGRTANHAENVYLQLLIEQGAWGLLSYLLLLVWTYRRLAWRPHLPGTHTLNSQLMAVFIALQVYGLFNSFADNTWYWSVIALVIAGAHLSGASILPRFPAWSLPLPGFAPTPRPGTDPAGRSHQTGSA